MYKTPIGQVRNPELVRALKALTENNTASSRSRMASALMDARLISPVRNEALFVEASGPSYRTRFEEIVNTKGERYYMAFTDLKEYNKWNRNGSHKDAMIVEIEDFGDILVRTITEISGFVINPFGENVAISKELLLSLLNQRAAMEDEEEEN